MRPSRSRQIPSTSTFHSAFCLLPTPPSPSSGCRRLRPSRRYRSSRRSRGRRGRYSAPAVENGHAFFESLKFLLTVRAGIEMRPQGGHLAVLEAFEEERAELVIRCSLAFHLSYSTIPPSTFRRIESFCVPRDPDEAVEAHLFRDLFAACETIREIGQRQFVPFHQEFQRGVVAEHEFSKQMFIRLFHSTPPQSYTGGTGIGFNPGTYSQKCASSPSSIISFRIFASSRLCVVLLSTRRRKDAKAQSFVENPRYQSQSSRSDSLKRVDFPAGKCRMCGQNTLIGGFSGLDLIQVGQAEKTWNVSFRAESAGGVEESLLSSRSRACPELSRREFLDFASLRSA